MTQDARGASSNSYACLVLCKLSFPRASITQYGHAKHVLILKYLLLKIDCQQPFWDILQQTVSKLIWFQPFLHCLTNQPTNTIKAIPDVSRFTSTSKWAFHVLTIGVGMATTITDTTFVYIWKIIVLKQKNNHNVNFQIEIKNVSAA